MSIPTAESLAKLERENADLRQRLQESHTRCLALQTRAELAAELATALDVADVPSEAQLRAALQRVRALRARAGPPAGDWPAVAAALAEALEAVLRYARAPAGNMPGWYFDRAREAAAEALARYTELERLDNAQR